MDLTIIYLITFLALLIASIFDLKTREVPDWLNFSLIGIGLGSRLIFSIVTLDYSFILKGVLGFGIFLALALIMYYSGQWGGGDSKLLMGLGALLGLELNLNSTLVAFIINFLFIGAVYGLFFSFILAFQKRKKFIKQFEKSVSEKNARIIQITFFVIFIVLLSFVFSVEYTAPKILLIIIALIFLLMPYLHVFIKTTEKVCMLKYIAVSKLTEGDWIVKDIKIKGKYITGPKELGITKQQINKLKRAKIKRVLIKEGIPLVPAFLLSFLSAIIWGNFLMLFV